MAEVPAADRQLGEQVRRVRRRRGLSLEATSGLAGISKPYLSMLENGQRRFTRRGLVEDLAEALDCSVADLTGHASTSRDRRSAETASALDEVAVALYDTTLDDAPEQSARPVAELTRLVSAANKHADEVRYHLATRDLGALTTELHVQVVTGAPGDRRSALAALVEACVVAQGAARTLGRAELALAAAVRGHEAAQRLENSAAAGLLAAGRVAGLMRLGARRRATQLGARALAELEPLAAQSTNSTAAREALGFLHLTSAQLAARAGREHEAREHLREAASVAEQTGEQNYLRYHFGPTNVAAWAVGIGVELDEGPIAAERFARSPFDIAVLGSRDRQSGLHLDLARAFAQAEGDRDADAVRQLDTADRLAPLRVRNDPLVHHLVGHLERRARRATWELDSLKKRLAAVE